MKQCKECGMEYLEERPHCHLDCWNYQGAIEDVEHLEKKLKACEQSHADLEKTLDEAIKVIEACSEGPWARFGAIQFLKSLENDDEKD